LARSPVDPEQDDDVGIDQIMLVARWDCASVQTAIWPTQAYPPPCLLGSVRASARYQIIASRWKELTETSSETSPRPQSTRSARTSSRPERGQFCEKHQVRPAGCRTEHSAAVARAELTWDRRAAADYCRSPRKRTRRHHMLRGWPRRALPGGHGEASRTTWPASGAHDYLHDTFEESQVFRIDHFLGKEAAQTSWRFASPTVYSSRSGTATHRPPQIDIPKPWLWISGRILRKSAPIRTWS